MTDTVAAASCSSSGAAEMAGSKKVSKYNPLLTQYHFVLLTFKTQGLIINAYLGHSLTYVGDARKTCCLFIAY